MKITTITITNILIIKTTITIMKIIFIATKVLTILRARRTLIIIIIINAINKMKDLKNPNQHKQTHQRMSIEINHKHLKVELKMQKHN